MAALAVVLGSLGYAYLQELTAERKAKEEAFAVDGKIKTAIATGSAQAVEVEIPSGYSLKLVDNRLELLKGDRLFSVVGSYERSFVENVALAGGRYWLTISFIGEQLKVSVEG